MMSKISNTEEDVFTDEQRAYKDYWADQLIDNDYALVNALGKVATEKRWSKLTPNPCASAKDFRGNYGVVPQDTDFIIDCDPRNYACRLDEDTVVRAGSKVVYSDHEVSADIKRYLKPGAIDNPLKRLLKDFDLENKTLFTVKTGGGGYHIYFKKPKNIKIRMLHPQYPGLEFKSKGHYLIGPGSIHPKTKAQYLVKKGASFSDIKDAPPELLELLERNYEAESAVFVDASDDEGAKFRYIKYLQNTIPAVEGQYGDITTVKAAMVGKDFGLDEETTYELMVEYFNPRCEPEWELDELRLKVRNGHRYSMGSQGNRHPDTAFSVEDLKKLQEDEEFAHNVVDIKWDVDPKGCPKPTLGNTVYFFSIPSHKKYHNPLYKLLRYNVFSDEIEFNFKPPWYKLDEGHGLTWTDVDTTLFKHWLSEQKHFNVTTAVAFEAALVYAHAHKYHPVKIKIESEKWDGKDRLKTWLPYYTGAKDTIYTRTVGVKTFIGAIARIYQPGCKFDTMLILEGRQGTGKSSVVMTLGGPWYADFHIDPHAKDTIQNLRGKWIIESSEMVVLKRSDANSLKSFLSKQSDRIRLPYGRTSQDFLRQCIFIGTINPDSTNSYLLDSTGNRRFWPVATGFIRLEQLKQDINQLWAEALHLYRNGESWHLDDPDIIKMAEFEVESRLEKDPWEDMIDIYLSDLSDNSGGQIEAVTTSEVACNVLNISAMRITRTAQMRIADCFERLGWEKGKFYRKDLGKTISGYRRPKPIEEEEL